MYFFSKFIFNMLLVQKFFPQPPAPATIPIPPPIPIDFGVYVLVVLGMIFAWHSIRKHKFL